MTDEERDRMQVRIDGWIRSCNEIADELAGVRAERDALEQRLRLLEDYYKANEDLCALRLLREAGKDPAMAVRGLSVTSNELQRAFDRVIAAREALDPEP